MTDCLGVQEIPPSPTVAACIILAWLAYPDRAEARAKAAAALFAEAGYAAWKRGEITRDELPPWALADQLPKVKRERLARTARRLAEQRIKDATTMLLPLVFRDGGGGVKWTGSRTLNAVIDRNYAGNSNTAWKRHWYPVIPVAHLAYQVGQHGLPESVESLHALLAHAETMRTRDLPMITKPTITLQQTIRFKTVETGLRRA